MHRLIRQQQAAGDRQAQLVAMAGGEQRARQPRRVVGRTGEDEDAAVQGDRPQHRIEAVCRRRADGPFAGILTVAGSDLHLLPGLAETRAGDLQRRWRRQHGDLQSGQAVDQGAADAVAERIAGRQHGDAAAGGEGVANPSRAQRQGAVERAQLAARCQFMAHELQRPFDADHQRGSAQAVTRAAGEAAPAVVEDADDGTGRLRRRLRGLHVHRLGR
ncbi:MAG: hypothetical protein AW07_03355 [Candidatus Accumulibacter sp. SK-11]|nr:MAG: hypothetical protein AW07_03355 [Candidatus Accumulibacter sp. SK-11]